jgi:hypothetical protein
MTVWFTAKRQLAAGKGNGWRRENYLNWGCALALWAKHGWPKANYFKIVVIVA